MFLRLAQSTARETHGGRAREMTRHAPRWSTFRVALVAALGASASAQAPDAPCAAERLERLPRLCEPRDTAPGRDEFCCAELAALNDARCFCGASVARLSGDAQRALVPPLTAAQASCGVNPRVGESCASLEETRSPPPPPFSQPLVLAPAPGARAAPAAPISTAPSPGPAEPAAVPPSSVACDAATLLRLVQDGCAGALRARALALDGLAADRETSLAAEDVRDERLRSESTVNSCCDRLVRLDARAEGSCFCEPNALVAMRAFPANFRGMFAFAAAKETCGVAARGGRACAPFPREDIVDIVEAERSVVEESDVEGSFQSSSSKSSSMTWPPFPPYPEAPPAPPAPPRPPPATAVSRRRDDDVPEPSDARVARRVCLPESLDALLENRCDASLRAFSTPSAGESGVSFRSSSRIDADACCELLGLLNGALCFCEAAFFGGSANEVARLRNALAATPRACGFVMYAALPEVAMSAGDDTVGGTGTRWCVPVSSPPSPPSPPSSPSAPLPPSPPRPPAPSPPPPPLPRAPHGPTGPPGPPGPEGSAGPLRGGGDFSFPFPWRDEGDAPSRFGAAGFLLRGPFGNDSSFSDARAAPNALDLVAGRLAWKKPRAASGTEA